MTVATQNFFFIIYKLSAVVSIHTQQCFYPSTLTSKMLYVNFFEARFVTICLFSKSFIHNVFLTNFLTFYYFPLLLHAMFFLSTNITKIDKKKCQNRRNRETRTQNFLLHPTMVGGNFLGNSQFQQMPNFFEVQFSPPWWLKLIDYGGYLFYWIGYEVFRRKSSILLV